MTPGIARLVWFVWCAGVAAAAGASLPPGRGVLLPLQDRVGDPVLAQLTESALRQRLSAEARLAEVDDLRAVLRRLRIRDAGNEASDRLTGLADSLKVEWFFLATLHEVGRGRDSRRDPRFRGGVDDLGATPQVVLSASIFQSDSDELWWAGFEAGSGRDRESLLGLGRLGSLEELLQNAVTDLIRKATAETESPTRGRLHREKHGFLRFPIDASSPGRVAVVPMDSVADLSPGVSAELATSALIAVLDEHGFATLRPGFVREITLGPQRLRRGAVSRPEREALAGTGGANWIATGTVENYRPGTGNEPNPWVAVSIRLIDASNGRIQWIGGQERRGRQTAAAFDRGRIYSGGDLAQEMMRSLVGAMLGRGE